MVKSSWQHPWKHGRYFCLTWWKYGGDKDGVWKSGGWLCGVLGLPLIFCGGRSRHIGEGRFHYGDLHGGSVARECRDETDRCILGYCWLTSDVGALVLADFGGGVILDISIPTLVPLLYIFYLACPCLCNDDVRSEHAHNRHTGGGGVNWLHNSNFSSYTIIIHIT